MHLPAEPNSLERKILVVDDNVDAADLVAELLQLLGYSVAQAYSGQDGLKLIQEFHPDIAIVDLGMPGMDGFAFAEEVRRLPQLEGVTLIACTAWNDQEIRERAQAAGFDLHLPKPANIDSLLNVIASARRRG